MILLVRSSVTSFSLKTLDFFLLLIIVVNASLKIRVLNLLSHTPIHYSKGWEWQHKLLSAQIALQDNTQGGNVGTVLMLSHKHVYTVYNFVRNNL